jgi:hypothetical protein
MLRIPHCVDNRFTDGGKVVSPTHRPHFTPQKHYYFYVSASKATTGLEPVGYRGELLSSLLQVNVCVTFNLLNVLVQIANKMGLKNASGTHFC